MACPYVLDNRCISMNETIKTLGASSFDVTTDSHHMNISSHRQGNPANYLGQMKMVIANNFQNSASTFSSHINREPKKRGGGRKKGSGATVNKKNETLVQKLAAAAAVGKVVNVSIGAKSVRYTLATLGNTTTTCPFLGNERLPNLRSKTYEGFEAAINRMVQEGSFTQANGEKLKAINKQHFCR